MSRSYRKPIVKEGYGSPTKKIRKRQANRRVRKEKIVADGASFKKVSNSWDICDFKFELEPTKKNRTK